MVETSTNTMTHLLRSPKPFLYPSSSVLFECYRNFIKCVSGYHLVNNTPIKESVWECINMQVLDASGCKPFTLPGSHRSGMDLACTFGKLANTTSVYSNDGSFFPMSSYRLTSVCSLGQPGAITDVLKEIDQRSQFDFHSVLVRSQKSNQPCYDWYLLPRFFGGLNPHQYIWSYTIGQRGRYAGQVIGWESNVIDGSSMSIRFNMSSQLWTKMAVTPEMKEYRVASCMVNRHRQLTYIELNDRMRDVCSHGLFRV
jgi:hypothetical protein